MLESGNRCRLQGTQPFNPRPSRRFSLGTMSSASHRLAGQDGDIHAAHSHEAGRAGDLVVPGDAGRIVAPDHATENVHGGVRTHKLVAALPIQHALHNITHGHGNFPGQRVPVDTRFLFDFSHRPPCAVERQPAQIMRLSTAAGVKGCAIQRYPYCLINSVANRW